MIQIARTYPVMTLDGTVCHFWQSLGGILVTADTEGDFILLKWLCGMQYSLHIIADTLKLKKWEKINNSVFGTLQAPQEVQRKQDPTLFIKICTIDICTHQESCF